MKNKIYERRFFTLKKCPTCGFDVEDSVSFCPECGANLQNTSNHPTNNFSQTNENDSLRAKFENDNSNNPTETNSNVFETASNPNVYNTIPNQTFPNENQNFAGTYQPAPVPYPNQVNTPSQDKANVGFAILSWFIPLFGWIYWGTKKNEKPKAAKTCGIVATISFAINILLSIIGTIIAGAGVFATIGALDSIVDDNNYSYSYTLDDELDEWDDFVATYGDNENSTNTETTKAPETTTSKPASPSTVSSNWTDYEVSIDGKTIKLPCSWSDFKSTTGYDFKDADDATSTLKSSEYTYSTLVVKGNKEIYIKLINISDSQKTYAECQVCSVKVDSYDEQNVVFPGGLSTGQKTDETTLTKLFGAPDDIYNSNLGNDFHIYRWNTADSFYNELEIQVSDGVIEEISLDCLDF